jgi:poly(3-hydroxybutyrate) depolymerase
VRIIGLVALASVACTLPAPGSSSGDDDDDVGEGSGSAATSRCMADEAAVTCSSHTMQVAGRTVAFELPIGDAPTAGWPVVIFYQGSFVAGDRAFSATKDAQFAQYQLTSTIKTLLDRGYAVLSPNALGDGSLYWQSNVPPYAQSWSGCADDQFVHALLAAMSNDTFGPLDPARRYAMGISSGGFMTSRMAVSYAGQFRALAIASASYATCGKTCSVPPLPADHPPALFLHGEADAVVPVSSMTPYREALGSKADAIVDENAGHEWLAAAVQAVPAWFDAH